MLKALAKYFFLLINTHPNLLTTDICKTYRLSLKKSTGILKFCNHVVRTTDAIKTAIIL